MQKERLNYLHSMYLKGQLNDSELQELSLALADDENELIFKEFMNDSWYKITDQDRKDLPSKKAAEIFTKIITAPEQTIKLWSYSLILKIASVLLILSFSVLFLQKLRQTNSLLDYKSEVIAPGKNAGTLTLASGKRISLSDPIRGELANESGVKITRTKEGKLVYEFTAQEVTHKDQINTLSTGMGEVYELHLPDGTTVWLNSASSLTYSVFLNRQKQRKVILEGEAYFEVAKDRSRPFIVQSVAQKVTVLGTHFNVKCYKDEPNTITTLLEGSVKVNENVILNPGQQAISNSKNISVRDADVESQVAWKNGDFIFRGENLENIMREVSRWYNVEITYKSEDLKQIRLEGIISRSRNIDAVLELLESTGSLKFNIEHRKIEVYK
ncbi:FecR family protein [Pedobacter hiemivivus]|uniref:DUF4974 domain-containing protein n=1 Tax=Pedobacter hiemivivus TaxID=2530454 RepID=A0A4R0NDJ7_9SPHI|nr:FecR domain-containing protein [Pedobacter hiemivivus]TCC98461.1 DUF4974 domain-containing protein [Pedobacter hiemivivus]